MKQRSSFIHIWLFFSLFLFGGCAKTNKLTKDLSESPVPYIIEDNLSFDTENVSNPLYVANLLKAGIEITDLNEEKVSHSAINFYLDDNFLGLMLGGDLELISESCTNNEGHKYMGKCNIHTSTQKTYALLVTEEEYQNAKEFVEMYSMSPEVKYSSIENFKIAIFDITRKFFTPKKNQKFGT